MGDVKTFFDSFKEFVWDIIGYLIPGAYLFILVSFFINENYMLSVPPVFKGHELLLIIVISYVLGYMIYGLGDLKEKNRKNKSYSKVVLEPIMLLPVFIESKKIMMEKDSENTEFNEQLKVIGVRELRNIVMSYVPEADQKIYTFTFRSELSRHTGLVSIVLGSLGAFFTILECRWASINLFKTDVVHLLLYVLLIFAYFLLREPRDKFYRIAMTMPFNLFVAREKNTR